jgi:type II secretory pathway pseudopilin PulG
VGQRRRGGGDQGETLLELIMAIAILGLCVVAIGSGIAMTITISVVHRKQATAQSALRNYAELLPQSYAKCATSQTYASLLPVPSGFPAPTVVVNYWMPAAASFTTNQTCPVGGDTGLQQVALTLTSTTGHVSESLVVDLRSQS